jgi:hypothetical protein
MVALNVFETIGYGARAIVAEGPWTDMCMGDLMVLDDGVPAFRDLRI